MSDVLLNGNAGAYATSEVKKLDNWNEAWEAELRFNITRNIGLGIAVSNPLHLSNESEISLYSRYSDPPGMLAGSFLSRPDIRQRIPIELRVHYSLPLFSRMEVLFGLGCGIYSGKMKEALEYGINGISETWWHRSNWETSWKSAIGFHGGLGAEYSLSRQLALVIEVQYRHAKIRNLQATINIDSNRLPFSFYYDEQGTLYVWAWGEAGPLGVSSREFFAWAGNPPEYSGTLLFGESIGKAILDLSGLSLKLGIRINLF